MADEAPKVTSAPKPAATAPKADEAVDVYAEAAQEHVEKARDAIDAELKSDRHPESDGLADSVSGDAADSFEDHVFSNDPAKKAFPPGPDDPSKL